MTNFERALSMHDTLLLNVPDGASHDAELCPFCRDWSMSTDGVPAGAAHLELADAKAPYGDIEYADPGFQRDKVKRYPIDTEPHARAAWTYIHQAGNTESYSADQLASIRQKIQAALTKFGVAAENDELEKTKKLADAKRGSEQTAITNRSASKPNKATTDSKASLSEGQQEAVALEGGTTPMEPITQETHEALLEKALRDATASLEADKAALTTEVSELNAAAEAAATEVASLKSENERLNGELDTAQVELKTAQDEVAALRSDIAAKEEAAAKAEIASERAGQVRNLGLFSEDYITERASRWADLADDAWAERVDEWKTAKGQSAAIEAPANSDTASAMTGSNEDKHTAPAISPRRRALGLTN